MQTLQAIIMGAVQGLTEFLPVSSSGHIVISSAFYKMLTGAEIVVTNEEIFFDILIHLSTLFAVIIYFFGDIKNILSNFYTAAKEKNYKSDNFLFVIYILIATFITGVFGLFTKEAAHNLTENPFIVCIFIIITGCVLLISEKIKKDENKKTDIKTALVVGLFQGFAVMPGLSRSGMTISSAMFMGLKRFDAARFSFILSIPIILLASFIYPLLTFDLKDIANFNYQALISGMVTSFITGYLCIKYFMNFLKNNNLKCFAYYCFIAGTISAVIFYIKGI